MGNPGGDLLVEETAHAVAPGSEGLVLCGPRGDQRGWQECQGPGRVGAVGPGWGRAGRPRGSGEALRGARSGCGASGPKDLKRSNVIVPLL